MIRTTARALSCAKRRGQRAKYVPACVLAVAASGLLLAGCPGPRTTGFKPTVFEELEDDEAEPSGVPYSPEEKAQSRGKLGGVWTDCYAGFSPNGDLDEDIRRLGQRCGSSSKLEPLTDVFKADAQSAADAAAQLRFEVPGGGRCIRLLAVGAPDVRIDVAWLGADGEPIARRGPADAPAPLRNYQVLPSRGPLCVDEPAVHTAELSVLNGTSEARVQVWVEK